MELTLQITPVQMEALKTAYPDLTPDEAAEMLFRAELNCRAKVELKRARVFKLQGLKRVTA